MRAPQPYGDLTERTDEGGGELRTLASMLKIEGRKKADCVGEPINATSVNLPHPIGPLLHQRALTFLAAANAKGAWIMPRQPRITVSTIL
jgi:hypothetical protein